MSAPNTNIERQKRRHMGPLLGMVGAVAFALVLFFGYTTFIVDNGQTPGETGTQIEGVPTPTTPSN